MSLGNLGRTNSSLFIQREEAPPKKSIIITVLLLILELTWRRQDSIDLHIQSSEAPAFDDCSFHLV